MNGEKNNATFFDGQFLLKNKYKGRWRWRQIEIEEKNG